ncbi:hypothetical protein CJ030_MR3G014542 [Morella rubra]|uniref:Uncharacterized protein n=1 Tax=Morella rubra TaxID=262757 RepID=A0A6A1W2Q3_9ROSI|nr:hypothetical protein CJ030_MR3G014542 [Morella rubra]
MVAQEPYQDPAGENTDLQDPYEAEDALSLCDLPIYGDTSNWEEYTKEDQSLSSDNDFFEFLSEDFTASTCSTTANNCSEITVVFVFVGMRAGLPAEMELSDIRTRQSRMRSQSSMLRSVHCDEMVKGNGDKGRGKGLWRLLRVLGRWSRHRNTVVKASFGCIPRE